MKNCRRKIFHLWISKEVISTLSKCRVIIQTISCCLTAFDNCFQNFKIIMQTWIVKTYSFGNKKKNCFTELHWFLFICQILRTVFIRFVLISLCKFSVVLGELSKINPKIASNNFIFHSLCTGVFLNVVDTFISFLCNWFSKIVKVVKKAVCSQVPSACFHTSVSFVY